MMQNESAQFWQFFQMYSGTKNQQQIEIVQKILNAKHGKGEI